MKPIINIRRAVAGDEDALAAIGGATFLETYAEKARGADIVDHARNVHTPETYRALMTEPRSACWLAEVEETGAPVGYAVNCPSDFPPPATDDDLQIKRIYVLSRYHGTGSGRALMEAALAHAAEIGAHRLLLGVYTKNTEAIAFYGKAGFEKVGTRKYQVGANEYDDLLLGKPLKGS